MRSSPSEATSALQPVALGGDLLAHAEEFAEIAGQRLDLLAHFRQHGAEQHGGAHRLQCVLGAGDQRRRRPMADALQGGEHLADHGAAAVERFADAGFVVVERLEPRLGRGDLGFQVAQARGGVDQVLVELAPVGADLLDLELERGLGVGRLALRVARGLEFAGRCCCRFQLLRVCAALRRLFLCRLLLRRRRAGERQAGKPNAQPRGRARERRIER